MLIECKVLPHTKHKHTFWPILTYNIKRLHWIMWYVVAACDFVFCPNPFFLSQILVFIRWCLRVPLPMVFFLIRYSLKGFLPLSTVPSICGGGGVGGAKLRGGMDSNGWVFTGVCNAILAWNIYCSNPNPKPDAHSGSPVRKWLGDRAPWSTCKYNLATTI